jgi:hypothetical protein
MYRVVADMIVKNYKNETHTHSGKIEENHALMSNPLCSHTL